MPSKFATYLTTKPFSETLGEIAVRDIAEFAHLARLWFEQEKLTPTPGDIVALAGLFANRDEMIRDACDRAEGSMCDECAAAEEAAAHAVPKGTRLS